MSSDVFTPPAHEMVLTSKEYGLPSVEITEGPHDDRMLSPIFSDEEDKVFQRREMQEQQQANLKDVKAAYDKLTEEESKEVKYQTAIRPTEAGQPVLLDPMFNKLRDSNTDNSRKAAQSGKQQASWKIGRGHRKSEAASQRHYETHYNSNNGV